MHSCHYYPAEKLGSYCHLSTYVCDPACTVSKKTNFLKNGNRKVYNIRAKTPSKEIPQIKNSI